MADEQKPGGTQPAQPNEPTDPQKAAPDPQANPPIQDPKKRGQEAALEAAQGDPSVQPSAPKPAVPKAVPPPSAPVEGGAPAKPQAGAAGVPPKPAAPAVKPAAPAAKSAAPAAPKAPAVMAVTPWESDLTRDLRTHFGDDITEFSAYLGQEFLVAKADAVIGILDYLKLEADFDYLVDVTAADYPKRAERFDLIYVLYSFARNQRIRVKAQIPLGYKPRTAVGVHLTANWLEREVFDMFGIEFAGHPDMKRILLPDEWEGHPLRKDYLITDMDNRWVQENLGIESGQ